MSERIEAKLEELKADRDAYRDALLRNAHSQALAAIDEAFGAAGWNNETPERIAAERDFYRRELLKLMPDLPPMTEAELRGIRENGLTAEQFMAAVEAMIRDGDAHEQRCG